MQEELWMLYALCRQSLEVNISIARSRAMQLRLRSIAQSHNRTIALKNSIERIKCATGSELFLFLFISHLSIVRELKILLSISMQYIAFLDYIKQL